MVVRKLQGLQKADKAMMMQVHMNLALRVIWEQNECRSSGPSEIGLLDVEISYYKCSNMPKRRKSSVSRPCIEQNHHL